MTRAGSPHAPEPPSAPADGGSSFSPPRLPKGVRTAAEGIAAVTRRLLGRPKAADRLFREWPAVVREPEPRSEPVRLAKGVLTVRVADSGRLAEYRYLAHLVVARIAEVVGGGVVTEVRFVQGPLRTAGAEAATNFARPPRPRAQPDAARRAEVLAAAERIADPDLRARYVAAFAGPEAPPAA